MTEPVISIEQVDDVPVLIAHEKRMGLPELIDKYFPVHGNHTGLSAGWLASTWLAHIISEGDHRLNQVRGWVEHHLETLRVCTGQRLTGLDFTDDRLEDVLGLLSDDEHWSQLEHALNPLLIRVYRLPAKQIRVDSTTARSYADVSEDGLFQYGFSKDKRPDLPQLKINIASLDPLGMPLITDVLQGNVADDGLYVSAIQNCQQSIPTEQEVLYIGDSKMGAVATRGFIERHHDYYLCPLSLVQLPREEISSFVESARNGTRTLSDVFRTKADGTREKIAEGYYRYRPQEVKVNNRTHHWEERLFVVRSLKMAEAQDKTLRRHLDKATKEVEELPTHRQGKTPLTQAEIHAAADAILARYDVAGLLHIEYQTTTTTKNVRRYKDKPARQVTHSLVHLTITVDQDALAKAIYHLGWRVYATNAPYTKLDLEQAVVAYREEYIIERAFGRLKGKSLSISPVYLERDDYATGMVRLLSLGLRVMTLLEFVARRSLEQKSVPTIAGLYAGNPKRTTDHPTTEQLLAAFKHISLLLLQEGGTARRMLTPLSYLHEQILELLECSPHVYLDLTANSENSP